MLLQVLRSIYHTIWYAVAALIVATAVAVTLVRLSLPYIDNFRPDIQAWLGDYLGHPVEIGNIKADWQGWKPSLYLQEITVLNKSGVGRITDFKSAVIRFDPFYSLLQRQPVPSRVQINNPELAVIRQRDGSIAVTRESENIPFDEQSASRSEITRWLLLQRKITIKNARLTLVNLASQDRAIELSNVALSFANISGRTQLAGSADLPGRYGDRVNFAFDIHGDISTSDWSGRLFIEASAISPSTILEYTAMRPENLAFSSTPVTVKLWSRWEGARVYRVDGTMTVDALQLVNPEGKTRSFDDLAVRFAGQRNKKNDFALALQTGNYLADNDFSPTNNIQVYREHLPDTGGSRYSASFSRLDLDAVIPWLNEIPQLNFARLLPEDTEINGSLSDTRVIYNPGLPDRKHLYIDTDFNDLSITYGDTRIQDLRGHIRGDLEEGRLSLASSMLGLEMPSHFPDPVKFYETEGDIDWRFDDSKWVFSTGMLSGHTVHFTSDIQGQFIIAANEDSHFADLGISIRQFNLEDIGRYLPLSLNNKLSDWLNNALTSGEVTSLDILLRGNMQDFPFRENDGRFQFLGEVENTTLEYSPLWTPVDNLAAEVQINQEKLTITAGSGNILSADITAASATIANLAADNPLLEVDGSINGNIDDALVFVRNSPLANESIFSEFREHEIHGGLSLSIDLDIPLHEEPSRIKGRLELFNAMLDSSVAGIRLDNINGNVIFTDDSFYSDALSASFAGQDIQLEIRNEADELPLLTLSGLADAEYLSSQLDRFYPGQKVLAREIRSRVSGSAAWTAILSTELDAAEEKKRLLTIQSSLAGLKLDLPAPLGKNTQPVPLNLSIPLTGSGMKTVELSYGDILSGKFELDQSGPGTLHRANLSFGGEAVLPAGPGILINGSIDRLSLSEWFNFINTPGLVLDPSLLEEMNFNVDASTLVFFDQAFTDVNFDLRKQQSDWKIKLAGKRINGNITLPDPGKGKPLLANFSKFHISESREDDREILVRPDEIPPLRISVKDFRYEDIDLGELTFNSSRTPAGMSVDEMTFVKPDMTITGNGNWQYINNVERCNFTFDLEAEYLDAMLQTFNYSVAPIKDGATHLKLEASWKGSPADFSLANMDGTLSMNIRKGQFLDIEPSAGRLFGLLSLQTLPRRLSLDFSDLFGEGLTFDRIEGNFSIQSGNAYTNNLTLTGPSANIDVTGRTGLVAQDYDQVVTVTPQFADSLPVASALFGPIGVGVGAVLFLAGEMFESIPEQIDRLWRYQYTIKGSWDDPVVEKYRDTSKSSSG